MRPGDVIDDRFELLREAGAGGMGIVFQARDRRDGSLVALKLLGPQGPHGSERFGREAEVLAKLSHPAIVGYVAHGAGDAARPPYLVMQWLEGEDLSERLTRGPLAIDEALTVGIQIAAAAGAAHARGFVHRDLKPSNVFLVARDPTQVKLLDFGLVRELVAPPALTATGIVLGTVGYLSPEQARGAASVDARSDVFSIGCILYECLTGKPAFSGVHVVATLAKLLVEDAPRVRSLRNDVPGALDSLVARMLDKRAEARPADGDAVAQSLRAIRANDTLSSPSIAPSGRLPTLTAREQRVMAVILIGQRGEASATGSAATREDGAAPTMISLRTPAARLAITETMARFEGAADVAADGTVVATLRASGPDQTARAARCALALRAACPGATIALAVGRGVSDAGIATGEVIERAAALLATARKLDAEGVHIEAALVPLLEDRFLVAGGSLPTLHAERNAPDAARIVLGRVSPFVGRTRELSTLEQTLTESILESVANAVVVTGAPGAGKSRLLEEFLRSARRRHPESAIAFASGDAMRRQSVFGVASALVRGIARIEEGDAPAVHGALVEAVAASSGDVAAKTRTTHFLGEMLGCPFPDDASVQLRAARQSSALMRDQIARAWVDLVGAELARHPVLLVVEDGQWIDDASLDLLDAALRAHAQRPLTLVVLGRPEVEERLPSSWRERGVQTVRLSPLSPRAASELAEKLLGGGDRATAAALAERSGGNPFVLEELVRARARAGSNTTELPDSVLALVQARLEILDPPARRALRAASIFGRVAPASGVAALLGPEVTPASVEETLKDLVAREVLASANDEGAFGFRHDLVRDAAYAMLTDADRATGHALAGEWLEAAGELDAGVVAFHFDRGGDGARAAPAYARAAEQAFDASANAIAVAHAARAIELGAAGEVLGHAKLAWASARRWLGAYDGVIDAALAAASLLPEGSARWFSALLIATTVCDITGRYEGFSAILERAISTTPTTEGAAAVRIACMVMGAGGLHHVGDVAGGKILGERLEREAAPLAPRYPLVAAGIHRMKTIQAALAGDPSTSLVSWYGAAECYGAAGERRGACVARTNAGFAMLQLGMNAEAESALRTALGEAVALEVVEAVGAAQQNLGLALARQGKNDEALAEETLALESFRARGNTRMIGGTQVYLSFIHANLGELDRAEASARGALAALEAYGLSRPAAHAALARVLLARGRADEALVHAEAASTALAAGPVDEGDSLIRLVWAEALRANGREAEAVTALRAAHAEIEARAAKISDPTRRENFRRGIPENARTIDLVLALDPC